MSAVQVAKQIANMISDSRIFSLGFPSRKKYEEALSKSKNLRDREMMAVERGFETQYTRKDLPAPRIRNAEEDIGSAMVGVPSDRSDVGEANMIGGLLVPDGVTIEGGQGFARGNEAWASGQAIAERYQKKIDKIANDLGMPVQAVVNVMSKQAIDFSDPPALIMAKMAQEIPMTKTIKESLNKAVRTKTRLGKKADSGFTGFPDFAGFDTPEGIAQLAGEAPISTYNKKGEVVEGSAGELRKWFIKQGSKAPYRDAGMPSFNQINEVITDPELQDLRFGDAGSTIFTPEIGAPVIPTGDLHRTYSHMFAQGGDVSQYEVPIPFELNAPEANRILSMERNKRGNPLTREQKIDAFNKRGPDNTGSYEIATQKRADDINAYIDFVQRGKPLPKALKATLVSAGILTAAQAEAGVLPSVKKLVEAGYPESTAQKIMSGELPMDEASRISRAREQGKDIDRNLIHRSPVEGILEFESSKSGRMGPAVYATPLDDYGLSFGENQYNLVAENIPATNRQRLELVETLSRSLLDQGVDPRVAYQQAQVEANDILRSQGYTTVEMTDRRGRVTEVAILDPKSIRDRDRAAFDPDQVDSPNILATPAPVGAVGGLLASEAATPEGQLNPLLAVPAEIGSALNEAVVGTLDFVGPDTVNAVSELIGSEYRMPRLSDQELVRLYTQGGYMDEGYGRDAIRTATGLLSPL